MNTPVAVTVRPRPMAPSYSYSQTMADLVRLSSGKMDTLTRHGRQPAGMTRSRYSLNLKLELQTSTSGRRTCVRLGRIDVDARIDEHKVYVARDATAVATCGRDVVLEHENRHVRINFDCVEDAKRRIEQALAALAPALPPVEGENIDLAALRERYSVAAVRVAGTAFESAIAAANARHAAMDTNEAYARDWAKCR